MKHRIKTTPARLAAILAGGLCLPGLGHALVITPSADAAALAAALTAGAQGIIVTSAQLDGHAGATGTSSGTYTNAGGTYGIGPGIALSTGNVADYADGPNGADDFSTDYGASATPGQETLLNALSGVSPHHDVTQFSLEFTTSTGNLYFNVVFGSEEWPDYVGDIYVDGFGLYLDGINIALADGLPVNINHPDMTALPGTELNGVLCPGGGAGPCNPVLTFSATGLATGAPHTLTFILGDASDGLYDTTVYLAGLAASTPVPEPATLTLLGLGLVGMGYWRRGVKPGQ